MTNYTLYETVGMKDTVVEIMLFISRGLFFIALAAAVVGIFLLAFKFKKKSVCDCVDIDYFSRCVFRHFRYGQK